MKRFLLPIAGLVVGATFAAGAALPNISGAQWAEASQIVGTLNALINQLNGGTGYTGTAQTVSLGSSCVGTTAGLTAVCTGQRGVATFTGQASVVSGTVLSLVITDTAITTASVCNATIGLTTAAANSAPYVTNFTPVAGQVLLNLANGSATATGAGANFAIMFQCT